MKRMIPFLMLAFGLAACQDEGPTVPIDGPEFAKGGNKCETPPCGKDGGGGEATAQVTLCAKQAVIEQINGIGEEANVTSTDPTCGVTDAPLAPSGTFTYAPEGPVFKWEFKGAGFPKPERGPAYGAHRYVLIIYENPWPGGSGLKCLSSGIYDEAAIPNGKGGLRLQGTAELNGPLENAKIWIVRWAWVDCTLGQLTDDAVNPGNPPWPYWPVPGTPDATYSIWGPYWNGGFGMFAYDWLFEEDFVNYIDTDAP